MAFYRKHRPQKFKEIVGQKHIKRVLTNALISNNITHAYLFSGPRGVGKTTMARLMAKSLNCQNRKKGEYEPCDNCSSCEEIKNDKSLDVIEIDAASNRGIDEIRELKERIKFLPSKSTYKIFIIDEVHMLTKEAFNALLKTLEEPPKHVIIIMATTELHKIPDTILSRVQQFDFRKASLEETIESLQDICQRESLKTDKNTLNLIARYSEGSFRDALSLLDQIASTGEKNISLSAVQDALGLPPQDIIEKFINYLKDKNGKQAIDLVNEVYESGYNLDQFIDANIETLRQEIIKNQNYSLLSIINILLDAKKELKDASLPQLPLEIAVINICGIRCQMPPLNANPRIAGKLKCQSNNSKVTKTEDNQPSVKDTPPYAKSEKPQNVSLEKIKGIWEEFLKNLEPENHSLTMILREVKPIEISGNTLTISVPSKFYAERIREPKKYAIVCNIMEKTLGQALSFECVIDSVAKSAKIKENNALNDVLEVFEEEK